MTRRPRKPDEHLVTARLLCHAYGQMGEIATAGAFFTYFIVMQLYGFSPSNLFGLVSMNAMVPQSQTMNPNNTITYSPLPYFNNITNYNSSSPTLGGDPLYYPPCQSSFYTKNNGYTFPDWLSTLNSRIDLRTIYTKCNPSNTSNYIPAITLIPQSEVLNTWSHITGQYVAYTTESIFYAQSAYFVTVVLVQWSNVFACKSRKVKFIFILGFFDLFRI